MKTAQALEHVDVVVVGAGLSGIGAAAQLRRGVPGLSLAVLESRGALGGTWDLFRYPGVRSDSDMYTLGYRFRPWTGAKAIADAADIRDYLSATADEEGVTPLVRFGQRVVAAEWRSADARWELTVLRRDPAAGEWTEAEGGATVRMTCSFLFACTGYYRYDEGWTPEIDGLDSFGGDVVHPQRWPEDLPVRGGRAVVIGSGATAVTLVPALARQGAAVTMLQRSPTYVAAVPSRDRLAGRLAGRVPPTLAYRIVRAKRILGSILLYQLARRRPETMKRTLRQAAVAKLPAGFDVDTHFTPRYEPWDQRLCAVPSGDLFRAISSGEAEVVTGAIERIEPDGVRLTDGRHVPADVLVTATGLNVLGLGGMRLTVDGRPVDPGARLAYKGMMLDGVPNLAFTIGYTNASWTLKADLVAGLVVRLLRRMRRRGTPIAVVPEQPAGGATAPLIELSSGYVRRGEHLLPRQGLRAPWRLHQNYLRDLVLFRLARLGRSVRFEGRHEEPAAAARQKEEVPA